jgi:TPR repeat protein
MSGSSSSGGDDAGGGEEGGGGGGVHVARSLFEEGIAVSWGSDFKRIDEKRGRVLIEAASAAGCPSAEAYCHYAGWGGFAEDEDKAFVMFQKIAEETGFGFAEKMIGWCFKKGRGVEQNWTKAVEWYTKATEKGDSNAMNNLGYCFKKGEGVEQNSTKAVEWCTKAAEKGDSTAMFNLGHIFEYGRGVEQNLAKAVEWYTMAVDQGITRANSNLERARLKMGAPTISYTL